VAPGKLTIAAISIDCGDADGGGGLTGFRVTITPGDLHLRLRDNGKGADLRSGDGIFSVFWTPSGSGTYTLRFRRSGVAYPVTVGGSTDGSGVSGPSAGPDLAHRHGLLSNM
jgi:hypothetical protein